MSEKKVYESDAMLMVREFIQKIGLFGVCLFILFLFILPHMGVSNPGNELWPTEYLVVFGVLVLTSSALWGFVFCNIRIEITDSSLRFIRRNKTYAQYPLDSEFGTKVERKYSQHGIFTGTSRSIIVAEGEKRATKRKCWCIQKDDYAEMMAELKKGQKAYVKDIYDDISIPEQRAADEHNANMEGTVFNIPKAELMAGERKYMVQISVFAVIISAFVLSVWYFAIRDLVARGMGGATIITHSGFIALFVFSLFIVFFPVVRFRRYVDKLPERIVLSSGSFRVDEEHIPVWEIEQIEMTPPNYGATKGFRSSRRRMVIKYERGVLEYQIGNTDPTIHKYHLHKFVYEDYHKLCDVVEKWCEQNGVKFILQYE